MLLDKYLIYGHKWLSTCQKSNPFTTYRPFIGNAAHSMIYKTTLSRLLLIDHRNYSTHTQRHWKQLVAATSKHDTTFSVMSYNILAQNYVDSQPSLYVGHDANSLQWPHRFNALKREIDDIDPDILCLQEVQQNHLDDITGYFRDLGYVTSLYKKRTGLQVDGCAIFYKRHLFDLIECHFVDYFQPGIKILNRCNVAVIGRLALKSQPHKQFIVSTTHLLFNPKRHDVRLAQIQVLLAELDRIARHDDHFHRMVPIILTGDFNVQQHSDEFRLLIGEKVYPMQLLNRMNFHSKNHKQFLPGALGISDNCQHLHVVTNKNRYQTALHRTIQNTSFSKNVQKRMITNEEINHSQLPFNTGELQHNLSLVSTHCDKQPFEIDTKHASTYHNKWIMVDYIFYSADTQIAQSSPKLTLLANYQLPTIDECARIGPIPNASLGSDHYTIASRFAID